MQSLNFRTARSNLTEVLNNVEAAEEVEITRRGREHAALVYKIIFAFQKVMTPDAECAAPFDTLDTTNKKLVNR
ncbi:type II toxin-antitoxin system prevent-host-death family antitoxin [Escherichia coli]|uniref:type II toxin-antitoxin system Phd/YefM family antitoxin n=1 Tax=Escherichia coli TaxID=562 RepID=UPI003987E9AB